MIMIMKLEKPVFPIACVLCLLVLLLRRMWVRRLARQDPLESLPWAGRRKQIFSRLRANLRDYKQGMQILNEGYNSVSLLIPALRSGISSKVSGVIKCQILLSNHLAVVEGETRPLLCIESD